MQENFHGWYKSKFVGFVNGFRVKKSVECEDLDGFVVIDTYSVAPKFRIGTLKGTLLHHNRTVLWADSTYEAIEDNVLASSEFIKHGPDNAVTEVFYPLLKWTEKGIVVSCDYGVDLADGRIVPTRHPAFILLTAGPLLLEKVPGSPQGGPSSISTANDPHGVLRLFEYTFHRLYSFIATDRRSNQDVADSYARAKAIYQQYLSTQGRSFSTPIVRLWSTRSGNVQHLGDQAKVTEVFTSGFSFATPGSTVSFSGLPSLWSEALGDESVTFPNAISVLHYNDVPNPSPLHIDIPSRHSKVVFNFDSSQLPDYGTGNEDKKTASSIPKIHVTHRVHPQMEYPEFIAAMLACQYDIFQVSQHTGYGAWIVPNDHRIVQSWEDLRHAESVPLRWRSNRVYASHWYHNPVLLGGLDQKHSRQGIFSPHTIPVCHLNDPVLCMNDLTPGSLYDYNVVLNNYCRNKAYGLFWRVKGPSLLPFQSMLPHLGYKNPGSEFEGAAFPLGNAAQSWTQLGEKAGVDAIHSKQNLYASRIPWRGKEIGYLRCASFELSDPFLLMHDVRMGSPEENVAASPRLGSEHFCKVFAALMPVIASCPAVVIDIRANMGGLDVSSYMASFFGGGDRLGPGGMLAVPNPSSINEISSPVMSTWGEELAKRGIESYRGTVESAELMQAKIFVQESLFRYGKDCVFQGGKVVILTDECACSEGDEFIHYFLGDGLDRDIGANTKVILVGQGDYRVRGGSMCGFTSSGLPNYTSNVNPIPVSRIENGGLGFLQVGRHRMGTQSRYTAPDVLLPDEIEMVWHDMHPNTPRSQWRDSWLETALDLSV